MIEPAHEGTGRYVFDSSSLIELERSGRLRDLPSPKNPLFVPDRVAREVVRGGKKARLPLERWLERGRTTNLLPEEGRHYLTFLAQERPKIHDGEAAALAVALYRGATLVTEETAVQTKADSHDVRWVPSSRFLEEWQPRLPGL